jgi:hypothetical protein
MLGTEKNLHFPKLEKISKDLYELNWKPMESEIKRTYENLLQTPLSQNPLPEPLMDFTKNLRFKIPTEHMRHIKRCCHMSIIESNQKLRLNHQNEKPLQEISSCYIWTSFCILSDCIWNTKVKKYDDNEINKLAPYLWNYRFWWYQIDPTFTGHEYAKQLIKKSKILDLMQNPDSRKTQISQYLQDYAYTTISPKIVMSVNDRKKIHGEKKFQETVPDDSDRIGKDADQRLREDWTESLHKMDNKKINIKKTNVKEKEKNIQVERKIQFFRLLSIDELFMRGKQVKKTIEKVRGSYFSTKNKDIDKKKVSLYIEKLREELKTITEIIVEKDKKGETYSDTTTEEKMEKLRERVLKSLPEKLKI